MTKAKIAVVPATGESPLGQLVQEMQALQASVDRFEEIKKRVKVLVETLATVDAGHSADVHVAGVEKALRVSLGSRTTVDSKRLAAEQPGVYRRYSRVSNYPQASWVNR